MLTLENISKSFGNNLVLNKIQLNLNPGIYGLLGPNGAGKSTLFRIIGTILTPDEGSVFFNGVPIEKENFQAYKGNLGYMPQDFGFYPGFSVERLLQHFAILKGINKKEDRKNQINYLLEKTNLLNQRRKKISKLSGGMLRRAGVAQSLLGNPQILLLDEPTVGLDPIERSRFNKLLREISKNKVILISSHLVEDISTIADKVIVMDQGKILANDTVQTLIDLFTGKLWSIENSRLNESPSKNIVIIDEKRQNNISYTIVYNETELKPPFIKVKPNLEDVYFTLLNKSVD